MDDRDIQPLPDAVAARLPLAEGAVGDGKGGHSLLLRRDALIASDALQMIAALTRRSGAKAGKSVVTGSGQGRQSSMESSSYLVFRIGASRRACLLSDISTIVPLDPDHGRLRCPGVPVRGLDSYRGRPLTLIDLNPNGPSDSDGSSERMVLVVQDGNVATGFVVDRLETVTNAVSHATPRIAQRDGGDDASFIQVRIAGKEEAVRLCRLETELSHLCSA